ncbi:hypothetical protein DM02DRAFT_156018 [Periconia macrospinosa]|uniref:Uncharacterized protein n=1 Tax=Periconia macrospinosa TaxID=97972 RepID=A0A2V1EDL6_9PLEO|nr:hypothetical protein DM02DRAFT_156018 [Periconia macrospinosa]
MIRSILLVPFIVDMDNHVASKLTQLTHDARRKRDELKYQEIKNRMVGKFIHISFFPIYYYTYAQSPPPYKPDQTAHNIKSNQSIVGYHKQDLSKDRQTLIHFRIRIPLIKPPFDAFVRSFVRVLSRTPRHIQVGNEKKKQFYACPLSM